MSCCIPRSGGCERALIDPFVAHLNRLETASLEYRACLDQRIRNSPQPEALYVDAVTGEAVVFERKTLVWPKGFAADRSRDHALADLIFDGLEEATRECPYMIELPIGAAQRRAEIVTLAKAIVSQCVISMTNVTRGLVLTGVLQSGQWRFLREEPWARDDDEPAQGLAIRWAQPAHVPGAADPPSGLMEELNRMLRECERKFATYPMARQVILMDQYGAVRYAGAEWWRMALLDVWKTPPNRELWISLYDWITECEQGWIFKRVV